MGRRRALSDEQEQTLVALVDRARIPVEVAGRALGVSRRTAQRALARQRAGREPATLAELLAELPSLDEVLELADLSPPRRRRRRRPGSWQEAAEELERLERDRLPR
jgi:hypothetical protein